MSPIDDEHLGRLLNDNVDDQTGPPRAAPTFQPTSTLRSASWSWLDRRWILPLVAVASVATITVGTVGVTQVLSSRGSASPGTQLPTPTAPVSSLPASPTGPALSASATTSAAPSATTRAPTTPPSVITVTLAGARVALPPGWVVRSEELYLHKGATLSYPQTWCLTPGSAPVTEGACPLTLAAPRPAEIDRQPLDYDVPGGEASNPRFCDSASSTTSHLLSGNKSFGGREAEWRHWDITCSGSAGPRPEQYVVPTAPAFILYTRTGTTTEQAAMTYVAARSALPPSTAPLRYIDRGFLRSVTPINSGVHVEIDRTAGYDDHGQPVNNESTTYGYVVPATVWAKNRSAPRIGTLISLNTNGFTVTYTGP